MQILKKHIESSLGDLSEVKKLIKFKPNINFKD